MLLAALSLCCGSHYRVIRYARPPPTQTGALEKLSSVSVRPDGNGPGLCSLAEQTPAKSRQTANVRIFMVFSFRSQNYEHGEGR
jgi:hypothetical protein